MPFMLNATMFPKVSYNIKQKLAIIFLNLSDSIVANQV